MGAPDLEKRWNASAGVVGTKIYVLGGQGWAGLVGKNTIYDSVSNSWSIGKSMPTKRYSFAVAAVNGIVYAIGGIDQDHNTIATVEAYDPGHNSWTTKAPLPTPIYGIYAAVLNGLIYVPGGFDGTNSTIVQVYDPVKNRWSMAAPLLLGTTAPFLATVGHDIIAAGGNTNGGLTGENQIYKASPNRWIARRAMPDVRMGGCAAGIDGFLYAAGGLTDAGTATGRLDGYDAATDTWARLAQMPVPVIGGAFASLDGKFYCIGGTFRPFVQRPNVYNFTQIYTP